MPSSASQQAPRDREILDFLMLFARHYLNSGGPTSRLEDSMIRVGSLFGRETEVFATPTGVFVTLNDPATADDPKTALSRIRETGTNLGQLCKLEQLLADLLGRKISLHSAIATLHNPVVTRDLYSRPALACAAFVGGGVASYAAYQRPLASLCSGAITALLWFLVTLSSKRRFLNPIFSDFMGAFLTLVLAALAHAFVAPIAIEAYAIGGIVLLVPGLALTTAIAELAEQNLVSGTAKFMQATLALLSLGLAYLLFQQLASSLHLRQVLQPTATKQLGSWVSVLGILLSVGCWGMIFKVPPKSLPWSTLTGLTGWAVLFALSGTIAKAAGPYLASVTVGLASLSFGRLFRLPSQVFSVPGIVAMLPGMLALSSFRYFASGDQDTGMAFTFQVAVTAVSLVFGLMTARIPFALGEQYGTLLPARKRKRQK